jgi:hypothetical protein
VISYLEKDIIPQKFQKLEDNSDKIFSKYDVEVKKIQFSRGLSLSSTIA